MSNDIGAIIKQARKKKGYSQQELADLIGVGKSAIAKWENGRVSEIKRSNLVNLSVALGLDPFILSGGEKTETPTAGDDGLSDNVKRLVEFAKSVPEDKASMILQVMKSIVEAD